jgi:hypothetical protein
MPVREALERELGDTSLGTGTGRRWALGTVGGTLGVGDTLGVGEDTLGVGDRSIVSWALGVGDVGCWGRWVLGTLGVGDVGCWGRWVLGTGQLSVIVESGGRVVSGAGNGPGTGSF